MLRVFAAASVSHLGPGFDPGVRSRFRRPRGGVTCTWSAPAAARRSPRSAKRCCRASRRTADSICPSTCRRSWRRNWTSWRTLPFDALAVQLTARLLGDEFPVPVLSRLVQDALSFPVPTVRLDERLSILELFHGPTLAFKDFGARFLARFFGQLLGERGGHATILVATSGDTGSAVARGFAGVPGMRVVVLYPAGRVSPFQEAQMATIGGNVTGRARAGRVRRLPAAGEGGVPGSRRSRRCGCRRPTRSTSAGCCRRRSTTWPATWRWPRAAGEPVVFAVPSGNLGNLTAGVMAARMGLPVARLHRRDQRQRRAARIPDDRRVPAAAVGSDALERDGRRRPEQLRAARRALRRVAGRDGRGDRRRARDGGRARGRPSADAYRHATGASSIRTAAVAYAAAAGTSTSAATGRPAAGHRAGHGAPGEVRRRHPGGTRVRAGAAARPSAAGGRGPLLRSICRTSRRASRAPFNVRSDCSV